MNHHFRQTRPIEWVRSVTCTELLGINGLSFRQYKLPTFPKCMNKLDGGRNLMCEKRQQEILLSVSIVQYTAILYPNQIPINY